MNINKDLENLIIQIKIIINFSYSKEINSCMICKIDNDKFINN